MAYNFIIKNEKTRNYRLISQLLVIFNLLGFVFVLIQNEGSIAKNYAIQRQYNKTTEEPVRLFLIHMPPGKDRYEREE